jgi:hypothetical protein
MKSAAEIVSLLFELKNSGILFCSTLRLKLAGLAPPAAAPAALPVTHAVPVVSWSLPLSMRSSSVILTLDLNVISSNECHLCLILLVFYKAINILFFTVEVIYFERLFFQRRVPRVGRSFWCYHFVQ